ncbi:MAG: sigma 54-interacting transcriptional regulator [Firmicutes bacterium]|nr:sigma 54-interacting transcriptional regulator [Bacillota bacterium]
MPDRFSDNLKLSKLLPILDSFTDAVFIDDKDGFCIWCNKSCEELYNISIDDVQGKHVDVLERTGIFSPSVTKRVLDEHREITIIHENRHGKKLLTTGMPIFDDDGRIMKIITTSRDITQLTVSNDTLDITPTPLINVNDISELDIDLSETEIIAESLAMQNVMSLTKKLATVNSTVLITGESGVGKGLIARLLHEEGNRSEGPFITVNCGAIPENLIESELFGYMPGAFTGSRAEGKRGLFEAAQHGTIFLDEISELPLNMQVNLLRVIQEREITPVGGVESIPIDVRIVSATNKSLRELVKRGEFREDLFYRLNVVPINVPPLRDRPEDLLPLIHSNLIKCNEKLHEDKTISPEAMALLFKYPWPGNIRELQNIIERLTITSNGRMITEDNLPLFLKQEAKTNANVNVNLSLTEAMEKAEKSILEKALADYGSTRAMAKALQVSQPTIVRKLHKYELTSVE